MDLKLFVFDMDDTLFLEQTYVESGFRAVGEMLRSEFNVPAFAEQAWALFKEGIRGNIFDLVLSTSRAMLPSDVIQRCIESYRTHSPEIQLLVDSKHLLGLLRGGHQLALITDGPAESQRAKIERLGLANFMDEIIVTAERGSLWTKPSVESYRFLQGVFDRQGPECVYVGDNPDKDFLAPTNLGWRTIRVRREGGLHESAESANDAEVEIRDMSMSSILEVDFLRSIVEFPSMS